MPTMPSSRGDENQPGPFRLLEEMLVFVELQKSINRGFFTLEDGLSSPSSASAPKQNDPHSPVSLHSVLTELYLHLHHHLLSSLLFSILLFYLCKLASIACAASNI
ncbi:hypothetical protein TWF694_010520 [Orbilia ellipsospora]|uniref:Uncharacterized protein n=1 Tax=Orbilia ellipsospora TaxID=2528407 RepID=A0AAV9XBH2_9PEZI